MSMSKLPLPRTTMNHLMFVFLIGLLLSTSLGIASTRTEASVDRNVNQHVGDSCTIFTVKLGSKVFFGNNEDYRLWGIYAWFVPSQTIRAPSGDQSIYGAVFFGFDNNGDPADGYPQGGMNDQGLCMDGNGLGSYSINPHFEREAPYCSLMAQVLWECATVDEVVAWFLTHTIGSTMNYQLHYADATGDAVVVSAGSDNEIAFTRISASSCLVSTNINVADPSRDVYDCWRYSTSMSMLTAISSESALTADVCRDVLDAVHQDGTYATKYSNVFDCVNRDIYLWYDRMFSNLAMLNLDTELAAVQPGLTGYYEHDPLFGAFKTDGDIYYRKLAITDLFSPSMLPLPIMLVILGIAVVVGIIVVSAVIFFRRRQKHH